MNNLTQVKHFIAGVGFSAAADSEHCPFYERDIHVACVRVYVNAVDFAHSERQSPQYTLFVGVDSRQYASARACVHHAVAFGHDARRVVVAQSHVDSP